MIRRITLARSRRALDSARVRLRQPRTARPVFGGYTRSGLDGAQRRKDRRRPLDRQVVDAGARHRLAATVVDGVIYAVGGESGFLSPLATVESYTTGSNRWATRAPLPERRSAPSGAGAIDGVLYVAGGLDASGQATTSLYAYEPSTDSWSTKAPMPIAGACGVSGVIDGRLYVYTNTSNCSETDAHAFVRYDPATNSWTALTLPAKVHYLPTGGSINGRFYLAGGLNFTDGTSGRYVEAYNPVTDQWSPKALAPTARYATAGAVLNNALYVAGGFTGSEYNHTLEVYDARSNAWLGLTDMPTARGFLAAASLAAKCTRSVDATRAGC